jgi:hypothetical protein
MPLSGWLRRRHALQVALGAFGALPVRAGERIAGQTQTVAVGSTPVRLTLSGSAAAASPMLVHLHENERTAVQVGREVLAGSGARLLTLESAGERVVRFRLEGRRYGFDPNRIFTDDGLAATLRRYGTDTSAARAVVRRLRDQILALLAPAVPAGLIALHNNRRGDYSFDSYRSGGELAQDAERLHVAPQCPRSEFMLVTTPPLFERLAGRGFHVVLQSASVRDDGSLSVWAAREKARYINVEAAHDQAGAQRRMVAASLAALHG